MSVRAYPLDGSRLYFDRATGVHVWLEGPAYVDERRRAPRVVQLGLTNRCNLRCEFCFRDRALASTWTREAILAWAQTLAAAGVLELGFGQGEPLLFPDFAGLVRELAEQTPLAINFTSNGLRLDDARLDDLDHRYGQLRLSYYDDNAPLERVRLLARRGARFGVNLLLTPDRVAALATTIEALVDAGCRDLLLLSYNGPDPSRHLSAAEDRRVARTLLAVHARYGAAVALRLSVCFGRRLDEVPQLRLNEGDCGAGDDFATVDSQRRLLPCSFHEQATPVASAEDLLARWRARRARRDHAGIAGCARPEALVQLARRGPARPLDAQAPTPRVRSWQGFASNHSTDFTLVGEFTNFADSAEYVARIEALLERCATVDPLHPAAPQNLWQLLGHHGEPPHRAYAPAPQDLHVYRPPTILALGRRALVHDDSTLHTFDVFRHQLLRGHGRVLWRGGWQRAEPDYLIGVDAGGLTATLRSQLARYCGDDQLQVGGRIYGLTGGFGIDQLQPLLRAHRSAFAPAHDIDQTLAQAHALAQDLEPPADPRHQVEWLLIEGLPLAGWQRWLARLRQDPDACMAEADFPHPFRLPARLDAYALLGHTIVRSEGAPIPGALQAYLDLYPTQLVSGPGLRLRISARVDDDEPDGPAQRFFGLRPRHLAGLSRPGGAIVRVGHFLHLDILPRDPRASFAQLDKILADVRNLTVLIMPEQPYAHALAQIDMDLDCG